MAFPINDMSSSLNPSSITYLAMMATICIALTAGIWGCREETKSTGGEVPAKDAAKPVTVIVTGDTAGWIVPCGCTSNQSGGLLRRGSFVAEARKSAAVVLLDAGGAPAGTSPYQRAKFEAILLGELAMGLNAHNLGAAELKLGADYLREVAAKLNVPFVSANATDASGKPIAAAHRLVKAGGRSFLVVGVVSPKFQTKHIRIGEPQAAVLRTLKSIDGKHDGLIVLAYLPEGELRELAARLPEADLVVGGPTRQAFAPRKVGPALLAAATNKGKFLVQFNRSSSENGKWTGRVVEMTEKFQEYDRQKENLRDFYTLLTRRDFTAAESGFAPPQPAQTSAGYRIAGTKSCRKCHTDDCKAWDDSTHSRAWATLKTGGSHVDSYCQQCHTDGYGMPGGFVSRRSTPQRVSVGCESCHGPSQAHVDRPEVRTPFPAKEQCIRCHDRENSPNFDYAEFWPQIQHGKKVTAKSNGKKSRTKKKP